MEVFLVAKRDDGLKKLDLAGCFLSYTALQGVFKDMHRSSNSPKDH
jgi:hypothetical protein